MKTVDDVFRFALEHFPQCRVWEDDDEVVIFTGLLVDENEEVQEYVPHLEWRIREMD